METIFPKVEERAVHQFNDNSSTFIPIGGYKALVNPDTEWTYGILSEKYQLIKHEDVIEMVEKAIKKSPEYGHFERDITFLSGEAKMKASYVFPEITVPVGRGDLINPKIDVFNSYDGGWRFNLLFGAFRLVCSNGLVIGEKVLQYKVKHFSTFSEDHVKQLLISSMESFSDQTNIWKTWMDKLVPQEPYEKIMERLPFGKKQREEIDKEVEISTGESTGQEKALTLWILFNILSQYVTHKIKSDLRRVQIENAMRKVF